MRRKAKIMAVMLAAILVAPTFSVNAQMIDVQDNVTAEKKLQNNAEKIVEEEKADYGTDFADEGKTKDQVVTETEVPRMENSKIESIDQNGMGETDDEEKSENEGDSGVLDNDSIKESMDESDMNDIRLDEEENGQISSPKEDASVNIEDEKETSLPIEENGDGEKSAEPSEETTGDSIIPNEQNIVNNSKLEEEKQSVGKQQQDGKWYFYDENGNLKKNTWVEDENGRYYAMPDGDLRIGWLSFGSTYYYCGNDAAIVKGKHKIDGKWYYFNEQGIRQQGTWLELEGKKYYAMPDGEFRVGWLSFGRTYYYCGSDGAIVSGRYKVGDKWYYFNEEGVRQQSKWIEDAGKKYYAMPDGSLREGWLSFGRTYYFCEKGGAVVYGRKPVGTKWYYFDENGVRQQSKWIEDAGKKYYAMPDGAFRVGWLSFGSTYYYCGSDGAIITNRDYAVDGILYTFDKNGVRQVKPGWGEYKGNKYYINPSTGFPYTGWVSFGRTYYYANSKGIMVSGWQTIDGYRYYFYPDTKIMARNTTIDGTYISDSGKAGKNGWIYENGYKFYYIDGVKQLDLDGILPKQSSYYIEVNRTTCTVTVYAKDGNNGYIIPVKRFACSVGLSSTPTPTGTYYTQNKYRWHTLMGPSYGQYCTRIVGGVLFHSVAGYNMTSYNLKASDYNKLGSPASHGCVRLCVRDAKWIYDNCGLGTKVSIFDSSNPGPLGKPSTIKIPSWQNWDPTDPNI